MDCTPGNEKADDVMLRKPAQVSADPLSADPLSALFPPLTDEEAARCVYVGMNAGIQGPLLTTPGSDYADDRQLAKNAGYAVTRSLA